jgi:hypothetical protein
VKEPYSDDLAILFGYVAMDFWDAIEAGCDDIGLRGDIMALVEVVKGVVDDFSGC